MGHLSIFGFILVFILLLLVIWLFQALFLTDSGSLIQRAQLSMFGHDTVNAVKYASQAIDQIHLSKQKRKDSQNTRLLIRALKVRFDAFMKLEEYESAISDAETWVRLAPDDADAYFCRGCAFMRLNEPDMAREDFKHILNMPMRWFWLKEAIYQNLGLAEYIAGNYAASIKYYRQAIEMSGTRGDATLHVNIGIVYFRQGRLPEAWKAYRTAESISEGNEHVQVGLAVLHAAEGQWDKAVTIWKRLLKRNRFFANANEVSRRYYFWTPPMAEIVEQIIEHMEKPKRLMVYDEALDIFDEPQKHKRRENS
jgi:tetratricopeptide (TPR) repeat protein